MISVSTTNMLDSLPDTFNEAQLEALRTSLNKSKEGTSGQHHQLPPDCKDFSDYYVSTLGSRAG